MIETMIRAGIAATDTNIGLTIIETSALQDGIAARKPAGEIADYLRARPRNMDVEATCTRDGPITTIRMNAGKSLFVALSSRFTVA
jgi:hypothetical protein